MNIIIPRIVIIGGGAGGLELATRLSLAGLIYSLIMLGSSLSS